MIVTGCLLMIIEIVGGLTISPYYGSSIFVWGSVIALFLGALSAGYFLGSFVADRRPRPGIMALVICASGIATLCTAWFGPGVNSLLLRITWPPFFAPFLPFAAVATLFLVPVTLIGMVTPIAVQMASSKTAGSGNTVGRLYALGAVGSAAGSLAATFFLPSFVGNRAILSGCGFGLIVLSMVVVALHHNGGEPVTREERCSPDSPGTDLGLRAIVFWCGVAVISLEVVGGAQMAPYFGSSVFVWGSIITVFLCAMTAGYYAGGRVAGRPGSARHLAGIVIVAGILIVQLPLTAPMVCGFIRGLPLGISAGALKPLFAAISLYFVPTLLLSMVTPFSIHLAVRRVYQTGSVAGRFSALSSLGNVLGALAATFLLIPYAGKTHVFELAGYVTVSTGALFWYAANRGASMVRSVAAPLIVLVLAGSIILVPKPPLVPLTDGNERVAGTKDGWSVIQLKEFPEHVVLRRMVYEAESPYHHVSVVDERTAAVGHPLITDRGVRVDVGFTTRRGNRRMVRFDEYTQSAVLLDGAGSKVLAPYQSGTRYTNMAAMVLGLHPRALSGLIVGGGGGVAAMVFSDLYPLTLDVVEIDPVVVQVAEKWFAFVPGERMRVHVMDGRMFLRSSGKRYDCILLDAYSAGGRVPFHLTTREFLQEVQKHLAPDGLVIMNLITAVHGPRGRLFRAVLKTFADVFGAESLTAFPVIYSPDWTPQEVTNILLVASGPAGRHRITKESAARLRLEFLMGRRGAGDNAADFGEKMFTSADLSLVHTGDVPLLTDDYAPVDLLSASMD